MTAPYLPPEPPEAPKETPPEETLNPHINPPEPERPENVFLTYLKVILLAGLLIGIELQILNQAPTQVTSYDRPLVIYARPEALIKEPDPFEFVKMWEARHANDPDESEGPMRLTVLSSL